MKKKILIILLVLSMLVGIVVPALAAGGPSVSYTYDSKTGNVVLTVKDGANVLATTTVKFEKNATKTYSFDGYQVKVEYNGSGVKSVTLVVVPPPSPTPGDALPNNGGSDGQPNQFGGITLSQYNNADFHCNAKGNGRVWTTLGKSVTQKLSVPLHFVANTGQPVSNQANAATAWHLVHDKLYICEECGSAEWVTFSNNSGLPDGKNIQMDHPGKYIEIIKVWLDAEGNVIKGTGLSAKFTISWIGMDGVKRTQEVGPGKHFFPVDLIESIVVKEKSVTKNYTLVEINGETVIGVISPVGSLDENDVVTFTNKEDPHAIILKEWIGGQPEGVEAVFDIYEYDEDNAPTFHGKRVTGDDGVKANVRVYVAPGKYIVSERPKDGFIVQADKEITVGDNEVGTCTFINEPTITPKGKLTILKSVQGTILGEWWNDAGFDFDDFDDLMIIADIIDGMSFKLYKANADGTDFDEDDWVADGDIGIQGDISFSDADGEDLDLEPGWYAVVEELTGAALDFFKSEDGFVVQYFYIGGIDEDGNYIVSGGDIEFDLTATYKTSGNERGDAYLAMYDLVSQSYNHHTAYNFFVTNMGNDEVFASFCANFGSSNIGNLVDQTKNWLQADKEEAIVEAINYIVKEYGSYDKWNNYSADPADNTKIIAQVVIWRILDDDMTAYALSGSGNPVSVAAINEAIADVLANFAGTKGEFTNVVFLAGADYPSDIDSIQPQLVPVKGGGTFDNEPEDPIDPKGTASFTKLTVGEDPPDFDDFDDDFDAWIDALEAFYGQFVFELKMLKEGGDAAVIGDYEPFRANITPNMNGNVEATNLDPGFYVFLEDDAAGWLKGKFADGLFFEIRDNGTAISDTYWLIDGDYVLSDTPECPEPFDNIKLGKIEVDADVTLFEEWVDQYHKLVQWGPSGSLTSSRDDMPDGISEWYNTGDNELFYKVDIEALKAAGDEGLKIWIAERDGHNVNKSLGYYYILTIDESGRPIVTLADENMHSWSSLNVNGFHFNDKPTFGNNGSRPSLTQIGPRSTFALDGWVSNSSAKIFAISEADEEAGFFWFHVHMNGVRANALDANGNLICAFDRNVFGTQAYTGNYRPEIKFSIDGGITFTDGSFADLVPGDYTVELWVNGAYFVNVVLTVAPGGTATHTFAFNFTVPGGPVQRNLYCPADCGVWK